MLYQKALTLGDNQESKFRCVVYCIYPLFCFFVLFLFFRKNVFEVHSLKQKRYVTLLVICSTKQIIFHKPKGGCL